MTPIGNHRISALSMRIGDLDKKIKSLRAESFTEGAAADALTGTTRIESWADLHHKIRESYKISREIDRCEIEMERLKGMLAEMAAFAAFSDCFAFDFGEDLRDVLPMSHRHTNDTSQTSSIFGTFSLNLVSFVISMVRQSDGGRSWGVSLRREDACDTSWTEIEGKTMAERRFELLAYIGHQTLDELPF